MSMSQRAVVRATQLLLGGVGLLFVLIGLGWWVTPAPVAAGLGMPLVDEVGRSTQIGDLASFFLTLGVCILAGVTTGVRSWLYPAIFLIGLAACGRTIAWALHGASLPSGTVAFELAVAGLLYVASRTLGPSAPLESSP
jgi:hypothetical protein